LIGFPDQSPPPSLARPSSRHSAVHPEKEPIRSAGRVEHSTNTAPEQACADYRKSEGDRRSRPGRAEVVRGVCGADAERPPPRCGAGAAWAPDACRRASRKGGFPNPGDTRGECKNLQFPAPGRGRAAKICRTSIGKTIARRPGDHKLAAPSVRLLSQGKAPRRKSLELSPFASGARRGLDCFG
jgi:hypothetical protein